jgi:cobalt/nickel transport system ATP-binding protein
MIEMKDICFAYGDVIALSHVSFEVKMGETVILKGPNGSGKSTLLKMMNGLIFPEQGEYLFDGEAINKKTMSDTAFAKRFHQKIGYLFQNADSQLFHNSVEDEIAFGLIQMGKGEEEVRARVDDMIAMIGIEKLRYRAPYHLSSGEKKKVALASILAVNPTVIVFDEPISGLDKTAQAWMITFLEQMKQAKKTIVIATHNEDLALRLGDCEVNME